MPRSSDPLENAIALYRDGANLIPLYPPYKVYESKPKDTDFDGKHPATKILGRWKRFEEEKATEKEVTEWFSAGYNIGVITGKVSGGLWVADFDDMKLLAYVNMHFKEPIENKTFAVKTGNGAHVYFRSEEPVKNAKFCLKKKELEAYDAELDIKGEGGYVVGPASVHWSGKQYTAMNDNRIVSVSKPAELITQLRMRTEEFWVVKACLTAWVPKHRHDATLGIAAFLKSRKWPLERARNVLEALCIMGGEHDDWEQDVEDTYTKEKANYRDFLDTSLSGSLAMILPMKEEVKKEGKGGGEETIDELAYAIMAKYTIICDRDDSERIYYYRDGIWIPSVKEVLQAEMSEMLGHKFSKYKITNVMEFLKGRCQAELKTPPPNLLPLQNGILDLNTMELKPFSTDYFFLSKLGASYVPGADCPEFRKFLAEVNESKYHAMMQEEFGYCLWRMYNIGFIGMWEGEGGNGKGLMARMLMKLLGRGNYVSVSMQTLSNNRFAASSLVGKYANIYPDINADEVRHISEIRALSGYDERSVEEKFRKSFIYENYAKLFFTANRLPSIPDDSDGTFRRMHITPFPYQFEVDAKRGDSILEKCTTDEELSGLLNWAIEGWKRLMDTVRFSDPLSIEERRKAYHKLANSAIAFLEEMVEDDPEASIVKKDIPRKYAQYCSRYHLLQRSEKELFIQVEKLFPNTVEVKLSEPPRERIVRGIGWKEGGEEPMDTNVRPIDSFVRDVRDVRDYTVPKTRMSDIDSKEVLERAKEVEVSIKYKENVGHVGHDGHEPHENPTKTDAISEPQNNTEKAQEEEEKTVKHDAEVSQPELQKTPEFLILDILRHARGDNIEQTVGKLKTAIQEYGLKISMPGVSKVCDRLVGEGKLRKRGNKYSAVI